MKKILWVAFNAKFSHTSLTVRYLRECAKECGLESDILELTINNYVPDILSEIYEHRPDIIGIACYIWNIELVKKLLPLLRRVLPHSVIICGGPEVSYETEDLMRDFPQVDFVLRGEGEESVKELLIKLCTDDERCDAFSAGIAWRDACGAIHASQPVTVAANSENILELPFAYHKSEMADIKEKILYYETSRGCPFSCVYCLSCATAGVRFRPLAQVLNELQFFVDADVRQVKFVDRTFNARKGHLLPILNFIAALPAACRTNFHFEIAVDYLDEEAITVLQNMPQGRVQLEIGIQSTNPEVLKKIKRVNHWSKITANIQALQKNHNMHIHTDLIIGLPSEDMASFAKSFNDLYALHTDMLQLGFLKFLKGAAMQKEVEVYNYQYMDSAPYEVLSNDVLSYEEICQLHVFEQIFELYNNSGRCLSAMAYLIEQCFAGNAFECYMSLVSYWTQNKYHRCSHAARALYGILKAFAHSLMAEQNKSLDMCSLDALLRFDALTADSGQNRPEELCWNLEKYQAYTADFWRGKLAKNIFSVIHNFEFSNWRKIRKSFHIEFFPYKLLNADKSVNLELEKVEQILLFDYRGKEIKVLDITDCFAHVKLGEN